MLSQRLLRSTARRIRQGVRAVLPLIRLDHAPNLACRRRRLRGQAGGPGSRLATHVDPSVFIGPLLLSHFVYLPCSEEHHKCFQLINEECNLGSSPAVMLGIRGKHNRADAVQRNYGGACVQMRLSFSSLAPFFLYFILWLDCGCCYALPSNLGLFHILICKVYADGDSSVSTYERRASLREFYAIIYPILQQLESSLIERDLKGKGRSYLADFSHLGGETVLDGHGGKHAADFACSNLPRFIVEDECFPREIVKAVSSAFLQADAAFAYACSLNCSLASGTTALAALVLGRSLLVANAGDCRAVLCRRGKAIKMSRDHKPSCNREKMRIEALGGYVDDDYLNGQLNVARAIGDWHMEGMKACDGLGPLSAEPEIMTTDLSEEDEFLIMGCDGIWDVFRSQNAVDFARRKLQEHNDPAS